MMKVCIITYHSAHNFGSMLQAYATQEVIEDLGYDCTVLNYRMKEQKDFYSLLRTKYGITNFAKDVLLLFFLKSRKKANERFERFIEKSLHSTREIYEPNEVRALWNEFDIAISGSDQIWNKHSFEMEHNDWEYMDPYLLDGFKGKKLSYASSIGGMTDDELNHIISKLDDYDYLSTRERSAADRLSHMLGKSVHVVLDPTFLLSKEEWIQKLKLKKTGEKPYILYYSLRGYKNGIPRMKVLKQIAKEKNATIKVITPFYYIPYMDSHFEYVFDFGPKEFLESIYNADMVISESYHGTILSMNFGKDVYSLCGTKGAEYRKTEILKRLGMEDRIIYDIRNLLENHNPIDYRIVSAKLDELRRQSMNYLTNALEG